MKAKYTPGPWTAEVNKENFEVSINAEGWEELAVVYLNEDLKLLEQGIHNSRLVAAAPCLLEALQEYVNCAAGPAEAFNKAKAAIKKATEQ